MFFALEQWIRQEEMEEKYNKEVMQGWRFASDAARISDENASSEDRKHTSGGVFVANDSGVGAGVVRRRSRYVDYWNRGGIAQAWRNVRGMDIEEWSADGSSGQAGENLHAPFAGGVWCQHGTPRTSDGASGSRRDAFSLRRQQLDLSLVGPQANNVIGSKSLLGNIKNMNVVEDFVWRPNKAVTVLVEKDKGIQEVRELKIPQALPG